MQTNPNLQDKELWLKTIDECGGNIAAAARKLNMSRGTIYYRMHEWEELEPAILKARKWMAGVAEDGLNDHVLQGNLTAIIFYLKTRCGWAETQRLTGADGGPIDFRDVSDLSLDELVAIATGSSAG
jgi:hypothetical protein